MLTINRREIIRALEDGSRIFLRPLRLQDMNQFTLWGHHDDPRFWHYTFPYTAHEELIHWFFQKYHIYKRRIFIVIHDCGNGSPRGVGYVTLKHINWWKREGEMGVVFDPSRLNSGFGTVGIDAYLEYCFDHLKMKRVRLRVATFNERARRVYDKVGFLSTGIVDAPYEEQSQADEIMKVHPEGFWLENGVLMTRYTMMIIEKDGWKPKNQNLTN